MVLMLKSGYPSLCLVECRVHHCVLLPWKLRQSLPHVEVRFLAPRSFLLSNFLNLLVGPCQEKIFYFEHTVFRHCQISLANLWNKVVEKAGAQMEACGHGPGARGGAKGNARAKGPDGVLVGMGLGLGLWLSLRKS